MLGEALNLAKTRAAVQAGERQVRYEARCQAQELLTRSSSTTQSQNSTTTTSMEDHQYRKIIDSIPTFSGDPHENVTDWLEVLSLKFDIIGYNHVQKRRFIPQYLAGHALKWHIAHRDELATWEGYTQAITSAFPRPVIVSRDMNLKMLRERKQGDNESFTDYYISVVDLCHKHDPDMTDLQIIDWLKAGMHLKLYEKFQGDDFTTPQALLTRAQRVELDNAVLEARQRENVQQVPIFPSAPVQYDHYKHWNAQPYSSPASKRPYPPPLLSLPSPASFSPFSTPSVTRVRSGFQSTTSGHFNPRTTDGSIRPRRPIVCYSCGEPGHISPQCPYYPKD